MSSTCYPPLMFFFQDSFAFSFVLRGPHNGTLESYNCFEAICVFLRWVQQSVTEWMSSFVLIEWLCVSPQPGFVRLMMGAKPSLRLIHYHGLISLQPNITPWITSFSCRVAAQTPQDQFTVCNILFIKVQEEIIVVTGDLCMLSGILKNWHVFFMPLLPKGVSVITLLNKQDLFQDSLSIFCCRVAHCLKTATALVIMTRYCEWVYDTRIMFLCKGLGNYY